MPPNTDLEYEWHPDAATSDGRPAVPSPSHVNTGYPATSPAHQATFEAQGVPDFHYLQRQSFPNSYFPIPNAFEAQPHYSDNPILSDQSPAWADESPRQALPYSPNHPLTIISPSPVRPTEFPYFGSNDLSIANSPSWMVETYGSAQPQLSPDESFQAYSPSAGAPSSSYYPTSIARTSQQVPTIQTSRNEVPEQHQHTAPPSQGDTQIFPGRHVPQQQRFSVRHRPTSAPYTVNPPNRPLRWPWELPSHHSPAAATGEATEHQDDALAPPAETPLTADHPNWRLTQDMYHWMVATLDPKKRPNKKTPAPSGQCKLCASVCKRSGTLQQHIIILHRQKLARRVIAGQRYNVELALAFVVAQMRSDQGGALPDPESIQFTDLLARHPEGLPVLSPTEFPQLREKLMEFCGEERWIGVKCERCGMMMSRRTALEEHLPMCPGRKSRRASEPSTPIGNPAVGLWPPLTPNANSTTFCPTFHQA